MDSNAEATLTTTGSGGRIRAHHGYSRNGCARCKQQRVRCDEGHPECERCLRVGIKCPGYEQKLRWSAKHEVFRQDVTSRRGQQARRKQTRKASTPTLTPTPRLMPAVHPSGPAPARPRNQQKAVAPPLLVSSHMPTQQYAFVDDGVETGTPDLASTVLHGRVENGQAESPVWPDLLGPLPCQAYEGSSPQPENDSFCSPSQNLFENGVVMDNVWGVLASGGSRPNAPSLAYGEAGEGQSTTCQQGNGLQSTFDKGDSPLLRPTGSLLGSTLVTHNDEGVDAFTLRTLSPKPRPRGLSVFLDPLPLPSCATEEQAKEATPYDDETNDFGRVNGALNVWDAVSSPTSKALQPVAAVANQTRLAPPAASIHDFSTVLVEFYFKVTAQIYSCYDSRMNPYRTAVVGSWGSSRLIYCTLQSMAAASLLRDFPEVAPIGRQLRQEAIELLADIPVWDSNTMFTVLMLGGTSSWHDSRDLGLPFFRRFAACLASAPASAFDEGSDHGNHRFLRESLLFWEMMLAFVADGDALPAMPDKTTTSSATDRFLGPNALPGRLVPHPWTGYCSETQRAVVQVGRLIRRQRRLAHTHRFASVAHINQLQKDIATARELEDRLMTIVHPTEGAVEDTEDRNTPVWHLLALADIIRDMGLIQLYHVFPDLLSARLERERATRDGGGGDDDDDDDAQQNTVVSIASYVHGNNDGLGGGSRAPGGTQDEHRTWRTAYALRTLEMLKTIPAESGTRDFQPFLLVALCSELRIRQRAGAEDAGGLGHWASGHRPHGRFNLDMETVEVTRARGFVHSRLTAFLNALPPKPVGVCLDIVQETWTQMDRQEARRARRGPGWQDAEAETDVYWVDVMMENGWETTMA
ncbi:c6 zinc finger domain containing protein [Niveomyces insectorum RCEF 264]|uniref:C6 zinc finger domain containing protein n=1 Tax=Niveomyces insectorum RCEF 264 TaxID=1081102 RepID=A0A167QBX5_9HYPO|nr:c6 zinc finger domain containing protein [Niveomyces insectorum RCEF 264]